MTLKTRSDSGSRIIAAIEGVYHDAQLRHPELPEIVFITGSGLSGRQQRWGHFCSERWATAHGRRPEILIAGERLASGAEPTLQTILHEATHALAHAREVKDTSQRGRYHNKRFLAVAEEIGLTHRTGEVDPAHGWTDVVLTDAVKERYAESLTGLADSISVWLDGCSTLKTRSASDRNNIKATCLCDRIIRVSRTTFDLGPISCACCGYEFEEAA